MTAAGKNTSHRNLFVFILVRNNHLFDGVAGDIVVWFGWVVATFAKGDVAYGYRFGFHATRTQAPGPAPPLVVNTNVTAVANAPEIDSS